MKNDLLEITKRSHEIIGMLEGGILLTMYDAEMESLDILTDELLVSMGYDVSDRNNKPVKELKKALINMYFFGAVSQKFNDKFKDK